MRVFMDLPFTFSRFPLPPIQLPNARHDVSTSAKHVVDVVDAAHISDMLQLSNIREFYLD